MTVRGAVADAAVGAAVASVLAQVTYPLTDGTARDRVTLLVVVTSGLAALLHAGVRRGPRWATGMLVVTAGGGFAVELLGTTTGFPFGEYAYAGGRLGPALADVPVVIGLAWTAGAYPAWCAAERVAGDRRGLRWLLAGTGLAAWDLYLDPQMVADGLWSWAPGHPGLPGVPQVPLTNYLGWLVVALTMAGLLTALTGLLTGLTGLTGPVGTRPGHTGAGPGVLRGDGLPLALFTWTWLGSSLAHVAFLGLPVSGVYGFLATGLVGVPLLICLARGVPAGTMSR